MNLGGFSNISFEENKQRIAFDISPVNTVLNFYANQLGLDYDDKGQISKSGSCNLNLLNELNNLWGQIRGRYDHEFSFLYNAHVEKHFGEVFYSAGVLAEDLKRPVNDLNFDVALHIVFNDKASQDKYQDAPRHLEFIDKNKSLWKSVRVFDSYVSK